MKSKPVLGLIGAIGAGKSAAAAILERRGAALVDADRIGHDVLADKKIQAKLVDRWGGSILAKGAVDRRAVAGIVFSDPGERKFLESTVYPEIEARCRHKIDVARAKFVVLDAAVMLEAGWTGVVDKIIYIDASRENRLKRIEARGWSGNQLAAREAAQWTAEDKKAKADAVIVNDGSLEDLERELAAALTAWGWL